MSRDITIGQVDFTTHVLIRDDEGAPATGLTEASIDIAYSRVETDNDVTTTDVTPAALAALTDAHTDWGFEEVSATDHPGLYRLDIADAVFASGAWSAVVSVTGTGLDPCQIEFVLVGFNPRDGVRLGLTALPNAAADAAGGLPISDAGGLDLDAQIGTDIDAILADTNEVQISLAAGGLIESMVDDLQTEVDGIQADTEDIQAKIGTPSDFGSGTSTLAANLQDLADNGTATFDRSTDSLQALRDHIADGTNLTEAGGTGDHLTAINLPNQTMDITGNITGNLSGSVGSVTGAVGSVTGAVGSVTGLTASDVGAIKLKTDNLPSDPADASVIAGRFDTLDTSVADVPTVAEFEARTIAAATYATAANLATVDGIVDNLVSGIIFGAAATGTLSSTQASTDLTGYANDQLIGRVVIWLTGDCAGEATRITDYVETNGVLTFDTLTTAPSDTDTFKIV